MPCKVLVSGVKGKEWISTYEYLSGSLDRKAYSQTVTVNSRCYRTSLGIVSLIHDGGRFVIKSMSIWETILVSL